MLHYAMLRVQCESTLNPTIGSGGPLMVSGHLANAAISYSQRHPVILHGKEPLAVLYV